MDYPIPVVPFPYLIPFFLMLLSSILVHSTNGDAILPKCCESNEVLDFGNYPVEGEIHCKPSGSKTWVPLIYPDLKSKDPITSTNWSEILRIVSSHPRNICEIAPNLAVLKPHGVLPYKDVFKILPDGTVWSKLTKWRWMELRNGTYCLDGLQHAGVTNDDNSSYSGNFEDTVLVDCGDHSKDLKYCQPVTYEGHSYALSLSFTSIFLLLTILVYIALWDKHNVHGWTTLSYFLSMLGMFIFTAFRKLDFDFFGRDEASNEGWCWIIAVGVHFFYLSTFCWMTCISFDLWWTFRALLPVGNRSKGIRKFLLYSLFGMGVPGIIVGVGILLDHLYGFTLDNDVITPEYGRLYCSLDHEYAILPYLYGPIAVLLVCNLFFFSLTVKDLCKIKRSTKFASSSSNKNSKQKTQSATLYLKLFLLMGIPWTFEFLSWAVTPCGQLVPWYWSILDYLNVLQPIAIFVVFVCKAETISDLRSKYSWFNKLISFTTISSSSSEGHGGGGEHTRHSTTGFTMSTRVDSSQVKQTVIDAS